MAIPPILWQPSERAIVLVDGDKMPGARWFPEARLNFAENLMRRGDRGDAFVLWDERGFQRRVSFADLYSDVSRAVQALQALGLRVGEIVERLPTVRKAVVVPSLDEHVDVSDVPKAVRLDEWLRRYTAGDIAFAQLPFDHPVYILFTSGTTGKPKCIVHGAGGALLQNLKMHKLQFDVRPGDRFFYFCTTNWVVWNLLFAALCAEASVMLYDGSPFARNGKILFDCADKERFTHFGTSAKYLDAMAKRGLRPRDTHSLAALRMILSTGSPLAPESFDYVYDAVKDDVCLSSISGGTDIMAAFADANPILPVYRGELQCRSLGIAVEVFDESGESIINEKGELVCTRPFPSMPLGFWNDRGDERYHAAYFAKYPNVWCHGDWSELTERGTMIIYGRSDATLNPGGVRIGTAEIYRVVELAVKAVVHGMPVPNTDALANPDALEHFRDLPQLAE